MAQMTYTETLIVTSCWCGISLAIPENLHKWMHKSPDNSCYCPSGHKFIYSNTLQEQLEETERRLAQERRRVQATRDLLHAEERSHVATKGHLTRVKKRVHAGVCPHCNRSFQDLRRHMRSKHKAEIKETA